MKHSSPVPADLSVVAREFVPSGTLLTGAPYGSGHINDTYLVELTAAGAVARYILQRINHRIFKNVPALMENIQRVTTHALARSTRLPGDPFRRTLTLMPASTGQSYFLDADNCYWRCYRFIEGARTYDLVTSPRQAYEAARAFGAFQSLLVDLPGARLHETIPDFHHTRKRFEAFRLAVKNDSHGRAAALQADIDFVLSRESLVDVLLKLAATGAIPERITHNDTKFNNVMLDDRTGEGLCVVDLDTVMPGLALYDFGDMVRSATNSTAEDETDLAQVSMRLPIFEALLKGYASSARAFLNEAERAHLTLAGRLITFEIGIRFLTDYLQGDVYFKIKHPSHNLDRSRNQFALVASIERQESAMQNLADAVLKTA